MTYWSAQTSWTKILFLVTAVEAFFARLTWNLWWDLSGPDSQWDCCNKIRPAEWHSWDVLKKTYLHSQRDHLSLTKCQQLKTWQDFRLSLSLCFSIFYFWIEDHCKGFQWRRKVLRYSSMKQTSTWFTGTNENSFVKGIIQSFNTKWKYACKVFANPLETCLHSLQSLRVIHTNCSLNHWN